jgi:hypothetical protein
LRHLEKLVSPGIFRSPSEHKQLLNWVADQILGLKRPSWIENPRPPQNATTGALFDSRGNYVGDCFNVYFYEPSYRKNSYDSYTVRFPSNIEGTASYQEHGDKPFQIHLHPAQIYHLVMQDGRRFQIWIKGYETNQNYDSFETFDMKIKIQFIGDKE